MTIAPFLSIWEKENKFIQRLKSILKYSGNFMDVNWEEDNTGDIFFQKQFSIFKNVHKQNTRIVFFYASRVVFRMG